MKWCHGLSALGMYSSADIWVKVSRAAVKSMNPYKQQLCSTLSSITDNPADIHLSCFDADMEK